SVEGIVDLERRKVIARHHTSAHILNAACRAVLGRHIWQGGSNKDEEKAHLDVTHYKKITPDELAKIEQKANEYIMANLPVITEILPRNVAEAKYGFTLYQGGAVPGKELRVVSIGNIDSEACGGTHTMLSSTGEIGLFKIVKREPVQDGVERITYKCGSVALNYIQERERLLREASAVMSVSEGELVRTTERFFHEWKLQRKKIEELTEFVVKEEAHEIVHDYQEAHKPIMKLVDLDSESIKQLAIKIAEDKAAGCLINKNGNVVCSSGDPTHPAKKMLDQIIRSLGGSGGGSDKIAQGKVTKVGVIELS
ncbi:alanine--tRNA ligase, partial [Candidatus Micrarchaeota archaeon]|nr:alanine--tRNA ligase [Candidatus Micrarchaeota archaeon]